MLGSGRRDGCMGIGGYRPPLSRGASLSFVGAVWHIYLYTRACPRAVAIATHHDGVACDLAWSGRQLAERAEAGGGDGHANALVAELMVAAEGMGVFEELQTTEVGVGEMGEAQGQLWLACGFIWIQMKYRQAP